MKKTNFRISTGVLNEVVANAVAAVSPPSSSGRRLNIMYCTQPATAPPNFVLFVNDEKTYENTLFKIFRKLFKARF